MKTLKAIAFGLVLALTPAVNADEKKEVTLKGEITCAKCGLSEADKCETVIVVKDKDKKTVYHFDAAGHKKYHADTCKAGKEGSVTGTVEEKNKMMVVTVKSLEYKK